MGMWCKVQIQLSPWMPVKIFCIFTELFALGSRGQTACGYSMEDVTLPCRASLGTGGPKVVYCFIVSVFANKDMGICRGTVKSVM